MEPTPRGDPLSPWRGTWKSTRQLAKALTDQGPEVSHPQVAQWLGDLDYSLQGTRQSLEGTSPPDRDAPFRSINRGVKGFPRAGQPVISVDAKKTALGGPFAHRGREYPAKGQPERGRTPDLADQELGTVGPYGVYALTDKRGWVSVGMDHDTAPWAVESIRRWGHHRGTVCYPQAPAVLITADGGGSTARRHRLWTVELPKLADATGWAISVRHLPPGTRQWNQIEQRMCCHMTENWRGRPLIHHAVIVNWIGNTTTDTGLPIPAELDHHR